MTVSTKSRHLRHLLLLALGQEEIGRLVKQAREDARLSQQELADRVGLRHAQSVSRYERGQTEIPMGKLRRIATATGKPINYFIADEDSTAREDRLRELGEQVGELRAQVEQILALLEGRAQERQASS